MKILNLILKLLLIFLAFLGKDSDLPLDINLLKDYRLIRFNLSRLLILIISLIQICVLALNLFAPLINYHL